LESNTLRRLRELIISRAIEKRSEEILLASGLKSHLYVDLRRITQDPEGINLVGELVLSRVRELAPDAEFIGGLETSSIPISTAVCLKSLGQEQTLRAFWVRKRVKDHGLQNLIEGNLTPKGKVVIVDDTVTTGGSSLQAAESVKQFGAIIVQAIAIVDRGAEESFKKAGIPFFAFLSEKDLVD
jgi:orotate phosphoribosyltransferase